MIRVAKPRNARSKRALEKRDSKEHENAKTALFVHGAHSSERVAMALRELAMLKKPHAISFNKQNALIPFEDASSLEFWGKKNDASLFLHANHQKKRPHNLTFARLFDGSLLDMYEMGIVEAKDVKNKKHSPIVGARPLFHFSGPNFSTEAASSLAAASLSICTPGVAQSFQHLKSIMLDFYRGEELPPGSGPGSNPGAQAGAQVALKSGLQHVISLTEAPFDADDDHSNKTNPADLADLYQAGAAAASSSSASIDNSAAGRIVHFRVYALVPSTDAQTKSANESSLRTQTAFDLEEIGPSFDFILRRRQMPTVDKFNASLRRPKTQVDKSRQGKGTKKNVETDEMGDMVGRVHVGKQDLSKLQTRKMKGLKRSRANDDEGEEVDEGDDDDINDEQ